LEASSSRALFQSKVNEGKLDNNLTTPSGVPGLFHDCERNKNGRENA
jgi:hypothetical protein